MWIYMEYIRVLILVVVAIIQVRPLKTDTNADDYAYALAA